MASLPPCPAAPAATPNRNNHPFSYRALRAEDWTQEKALDPQADQLQPVWAKLVTIGRSKTPALSRSSGHPAAQSSSIQLAVPSRHQSRHRCRFVIIARADLRMDCSQDVFDLSHLDGPEHHVLSVEEMLVAVDIPFFTSIHKYTRQFL
jgi:hypothetical protein